MDQNKNTQGQQSQGQGHQNVNRDQAEGSRDQTRGSSNTSQPSGLGKRGEKNSGGISNRDMDEQSDLPSQSDR